MQRSLQRKTSSPTVKVENATYNFKQHLFLPGTFLMSYESWNKEGTLEMIWAKWEKFTDYKIDAQIGSVTYVWSYSCHIYICIRHLARTFSCLSNKCFPAITGVTEAALGRCPFFNKQEVGVGESMKGHHKSHQKQQFIQG